MNSKLQLLSHESLSNIERDFSNSFRALAKKVSVWAEGKGFWEHREQLMRLASHDEEKLEVVETLVKFQKIMLIVTELAELAEGIRSRIDRDKIDSDAITNEEEEVADAIIRLMDFGGFYGLRIAEVILAKMAVNEQRPYKHGKVL